MYEAHLCIVNTNGKEEKKIKAKLKKHTCHMSHAMGIKSSISIFLLNYVLYFV